MAAGPSLVEVSSWRIDLLFFLLLLVTVFLTKLDHSVLHYLETRKKVGFFHIYAAMKEEILLVGCISLLLSGIEGPLSSICVNTPRMDKLFPSYMDRSNEFYPENSSYEYSSYDSYDKPYESYPPSSYEPSSYPAPPYPTPPELSVEQTPPPSSPPQSRRLLSVAEGSFLESAAIRWRSLLAAADASGSDACPEGYSQLFPVSAIHALHIMLFLVAVTQIFYMFLVLALCLWKLRRWRKYETRAQKEPGLLPHLDKVYDGTGCSEGYLRFREQAVNKLTSDAMRSPLHHAGVSSLLMWSAVNEEQYIVMRHIFVKQLGLENDFDFLEFVRESMENEFASLVGGNHYMWFVLFLWILCPPETYVAIIVPCLHLILALAVGNKMARVTLVFVSSAKEAFYQSQEARDEFIQLAKTQKDIPVPEWMTMDDEPEEEQSREDEEEHMEPSAPMNGSRTPQNGSPVAPGDVAVDIRRVSSPGSDRSVTQDIAKGIEDILSQVMDLNSGSGMMSTVERINLWKPVRCCMRPAADEEPAGDAAADEGRSQDPGGSPVGGVSQGPPRSSSGWGMFGRNKDRRKQWAQRKYDKANIDSAKLFWLSRPKIILQLMQMVYFGMSVQLSFSLFKIWEELPPGYLMPVFAPPKELYNPYAAVTPGTIVFECFTNAFILFWCALVVLPEYALCSTVGSHCPSSLLQYAQRHSVEPKLAKALAAIAQLNRIQVEMDGGSVAGDDLSNYTVSRAPSESSLQTNKGAAMESLYDDIIDLQLDKQAAMGAGGHADGKKGNVQKLMGAMYAAQLKKLQERQGAPADASHLGDEKQHQDTTSTWHAAPTAAKRTSLSSVMGLFDAAREDDAAVAAPTRSSASVTGAPPGPLAAAAAGGSSFLTAPGPGGLLSPPVADPPSGSSPGVDRWRQKQQLLMHIVQRQEKLKGKGGSSEDLPSLEKAKEDEEAAGSAKPPGFSLSRHSMTARVSLDKSGAPPPLRPLPQQGASKRNTGGLSLFRGAPSPSKTPPLKPPGSNRPLTSPSTAASGAQKKQKGPPGSPPRKPRPPLGSNLARSSARPRLETVEEPPQPISSPEAAHPGRSSDPSEITYHPQQPPNKQPAGESSSGREGSPPAGDEQAPGALSRMFSLSRRSMTARVNLDRSSSSSSTAKEHQEQ